MGYFTKKADPISNRARTLNEQIAALESQIQRLSAKQQKAARQQSEAPRSRARNGAKKATMATSPSETLIDELKPKRTETTPERRPRESFSEDRQRKPRSSGVIRRLLKQFQPEPPSNPRLVNYLAAGSIQGLRPLRYEKRVARNRVLFLMVFLVLLVLGILTSFIRQ